MNEAREILVTSMWYIMKSFMHVIYVKKDSQIRVISIFTSVRPNDQSFGKFQVRNMDSCGLFSGAISAPPPAPPPTSQPLIWSFWRWYN
ncbi:unnamed protein product [Trichogramma brassicae]|uniref:Uncharacterized protein n=1 Tax=Trichogramma brassicae TaxID=86971 RepID=A0A6H5IK99_9HYME|nr:unnamed protein product [Trichogramma brassicae]